MSRKLLVITGPTATGKTALGIELAKKFNGEILSADSQQVYTGNDIETGKDKSYFQWGIDIANPGTDFNVSAFVSYAHRVIADITKRKKLPIVVGGSGQYIKELLNPSETLNITPNQKLRTRLAKYSVSQLQKLVNPEACGKMNSSDWQNPRRLVRAIEVQSAKRKIKIKYPQYDTLVIGLTAPREILYKKIVTRRENRPDLIPKEFSYSKRQMLYLQKYLQPLWFDVSDEKSHNRILWEVNKFLAPPKKIK